MKTMSANAVDALSRAHTALLEDLRKLEEAVRSMSPESGEDFGVSLEVTRAHIVQHFEFEEQNGYLDVVRKREPRLERAIRQLQEEHRQLRQSLDELIGQTKAVSSQDAFQDSIHHWIERVRHHEQHENDVVQDAFGFDVGAED